MLHLTKKHYKPFLKRFCYGSLLRRSLQRTQYPQYFPICKGLRLFTCSILEKMVLSHTHRRTKCGLRVCRYECHLMISPLSHKPPHRPAPALHGIMGKSMFPLSGRVVVVGNQVVMVNSRDSEPLSCSGQVEPAQEALRSGWDSGATLFVQ